jgi:formylglycine-generating enzyme required for sulfatase activity
MWKRTVVMIAAAVALLATGYVAGRFLPFDSSSPARNKAQTAELANPAPQTLRDCPECPDMVHVSGQSFAAGRYEVTFAEWDACVAAGGCRGYRPDDQGWGRGNRPVIEVSWHDAQAYVQWLSQRTGVYYRLLTSAEWEISARAGTTTRYSWGDQDPVCDESVRNGANFSVCVDDRTRPVGSFQPNGYGLYDMHGNVGEWVEDCNAEGVLEAIFDRNHSCGDDSYRLVRGGSWRDDPEFQRSEWRPSWFHHPDSTPFQGKYTGFRVARSVSGG